MGSLGSAVSEESAYTPMRYAAHQHLAAAESSAESSPLTMLPLPPSGTYLAAAPLRSVGWLGRGGGGACAAWCCVFKLWTVPVRCLVARFSF